MTKLWLVRHAESEGNLKDSLTGCSTDGLSDLGKSQAEKLGNYLKKIEKLKPSKIITSAMERSKQTAELMNLGKINYSTKLFNETDGGVAANWTKDKFRVEYPEFWRQFDPEKPFPGGESHRELYNRVVEGVKIILKDSFKDENVLIVCHAGTISAILHWIYEIELKLFSRFSTHNCSITLLEYDDENVKPKMMFFNKKI